MMRISHHGAALAAVAGVLMLAACEEQGGATQSAADAGAACDRACLIDAMETYLAALAANDPAAAPLAANIAFVENVERMRPGEGLWESTVSGPTEFAIIVPDEVNQSAGFLGMISRMAAPPAPQGTGPEERAEWEATAERSEQPALIAIRLQFEGGEIIEAEHLVTGVREPQMANLTTLRPGILREIPPASRQPHAELIRLGESYYDALDDNDGSLTPFAPECERRENGMVTASPDPAPNAPAVPGTAPTPAVARDCARQLDSGTFLYIDRIENRRVFAADPVTGLVMGLSHFRHSMDFEPYEVTALDGSTVSRSPESFGFAPFDLPAAHIYKIDANGMMNEIEAMGFMAPYNSPTGWE